MKHSLLLTSVIVLAVCLGCSDRDRGPSRRPQEGPQPSQQSGPVDDPSIPRTDIDGRTPSNAALELVGALNKSDWRTAYSLYAEPYVPYEDALREWTERGEQYEGFVVRETRIEREDLAFLRVAYTISYNPANGRPETTAYVDDPEAWWAIDKVDGRWRVRWMPVQ